MRLLSIPRQSKRGLIHPPILLTNNHMRTHAQKMIRRVQVAFPHSCQLESTKSRQLIFFLQCCRVHCHKGLNVPLLAQPRAELHVTGEGAMERDGMWTTRHWVQGMIILLLRSEEKHLHQTLQQWYWSSHTTSSGIISLCLQLQLQLLLLLLCNNRLLENRFAKPSQSRIRVQPLISSSLQIKPFF